MTEDDKQRRAEDAVDASKWRKLVEMYSTREFEVVLPEDVTGLSATLTDALRRSGEKLRDALEALRLLREGCQQWASDEDHTLHYCVFEAYNRASELLGLPLAKLEDP